MADQGFESQAVDLSIAAPELTGPVLERLVSAAAARANLPVDRLVNALTVVDALVQAADDVLPDSERRLYIEFGPGSVRLLVGGLIDGQAEAIRDAAEIPGLGNVFKRTATDVAINHEGAHSALVISLD